MTEKLNLRTSTFRLSLLVAISVFLISGSSARSQNVNDDWRKIGVWNLKAEVYTIYYSPGRTVRHNGLVRAWFKIVYPETNNTSHTVDLLQFNCRNGKYRILQQSMHARNGGGDGSLKPTEWQYPEPDSVNEMQFRTICHPARTRS